MSLRQLSRPSPVGFVEPCQPIGAATPPSGPGWLHEIKHDGFRIMAWRDGDRVRLLTRNANDFGERYPLVVKAIGALKVRSCLIDGEVAVCNDTGLSVFDVRVPHKLSPDLPLDWGFFIADGIGRRVMTHTEIAFANERAIIADMLISLLTNVRLTYLPDLEPADAYELLFTGAHVLIAELGSQPATAAEISRVIGRPREVVLQRLDELIKRGYVELSSNRYKMTTKFNVPNLHRHMRSNINMIQAAAKRLGAAHP